MTYYASSFSPAVIFIDVDTISKLMRSTTNFRCTRMLVTKLIRLIIETGSVTGIYFAPSAVVRLLTPLTLAVVSLLTFILVIVLPYQIYYITPGLLVPKLYANSVYMVLIPDSKLSADGISICLQQIRVSRPR